MKSWLFHFPPLTSPTPLLAPVEQMSSASSRVPRLHTRANTIWVRASAVHVCICVICVHKSTMCISECNCVCVIYMYKCIFIHLCTCVSVCCWTCVLLVMEGVRGSGWCCGQTARHTCVCILFFKKPLGLCVCVSCLFTHPPPGQEFSDELCHWQVGSFGKSDTNCTKTSSSLMALILLSHTSPSPSCLGFSWLWTIVTLLSKNFSKSLKH